MSDGLRDGLVRTYRLLREHGLNDSHSGNASLRDADTVWITPTGCCADTLEAGDLVACRNHVPGPGASLDAPLHLAGYAARPEAAAGIHCHGPHASAMTLRPEIASEHYFPDDFEGAYYFPKGPLIDIPSDHYVSEAPAAVAEALSRFPVALVRGHGIYAWGRSLDEAYKRAASLESSARISWLTASLGNRRPPGEPA